VLGAAPLPIHALVSIRVSKIPETANFLRISRSRLYGLMDHGELIYLKLGRSRRIPRRAVIELAARELRGGFNVTR
jgi:excisionase family DNA binding protein